VPYWACHCDTSDNQFGTITVRDLVTGNQYHITVQRSSPTPPASDPLVDALNRFKQLPTNDQLVIPAPDSFSASARSIPHRMVRSPIKLFTGRDADLRSLAMTVQSQLERGRSSGAQAAGLPVRRGEQDQVLRNLLIFAPFAEGIDPGWYRVGGQPCLEVIKTRESERISTLTPC
jgi:hypothetical protein